MCIRDRPPGGDPDFAAVSLLSLVLGDTPGGRLHKRLVETPVSYTHLTLPTSDLV